MKANGERSAGGQPVQAVPVLSDLGIHREDSGLKAQAVPRLSDLGIHREDAKRWQKIAEIPDTIEAVEASLSLLADGLNAGGWATAAVVYAWTYEGVNQYEVPDEKSPGTKSISDFAALGIRGLSTRDSVRKYRRKWEQAIERGWATH